MKPGTFVIHWDDRPCVRHVYLVTGNYTSAAGDFSRLVRVRDGAECALRPPSLKAVAEYGIALDRVVSDVIHFRRTGEGTVAWEGGLCGRLHKSCRATVERLAKGDPF